MAAPDAEALPPVSDEGVDLTQVRAMLALTPAQRLDRLEAAARSLLDLRGGRFLD